MRRVIPTAPTLLPALFALALPACDLQETEPPVDPFCSEATGATDVSGVWAVSGEGTVSDCSDHDGEEAAALRLSIDALEVVQEGGVLALATPRTGFDFSGEVRGSCVRVQMRETGSSPATWIFTGTAKDSTLIEGTFGGSGPGSCSSEGTFRVDVSPR